MWREAIAGTVRGRLVWNLPLAGYTTYGIGGPAACAVFPAGTEDVAAAVAVARRHGVPFTVLGAGSNVLIADEGIAGITLILSEPVGEPVLADGEIRCGAGLHDRAFCEFLAREGISGFDYLYDIPGTVGGAIVQNAGMDDGNICDHLAGVEVVTEAGNVEFWPREALRPGYRHSVFKERFGVICAARFKIPGRDDPEAIWARMKAIQAVRTGKFPGGTRNCGSVFKRPPGDYAGRLIQAARLGGFAIGGALVSDKHRNFIINTGGATARDVKAVIEEVQRRVFGETGIMLEREVVYLG